MKYFYLFLKSRRFSNTAKSKFINPNDFLKLQNRRFCKDFVKYKTQNIFTIFNHFYKINI